MGLNALSEAGSAFLKNIIPRSVQNGIFRTSPDSKPSPQAGAQPTPSDLPRATRPQSDVRHMSSDTTPSKARIHKALFSGTGKFDPIDIDRDDDGQAHAPPKTETRASPRPILQSANPTKTPEDGRESTRLFSEQARSLRLRELVTSHNRCSPTQSLTPSRTNSAAAVSVQIPPTKSEMSFEQKKKPFSKSAIDSRGAYKPMDTLNAQKQSKQSFQYGETRKQFGFSPAEALRSYQSPAAASKPLSKGSANKQLQHQTRSAFAHQDQGADTPSNKRRKLNSPTHSYPTRGRDASSGTSQVGTTSPHIVPLDSDPEDLDLASAYDFEEPESAIPNRPTNGTMRTPTRNLAPHGASIDVAYHDKLRTGSPDDLVKPHGQSSESPDQFIRSATQQRLNRQRDSDDDQDMHTTFAQPHSTRKSIGAGERGRTRTPLATITPKTSKRSKIAARLEAESPDQLHSPEQTLRKAKKSGPLPLSPPEQFPPGKKFKLRSFVCAWFIDAGDYEIEMFEHNRTFSLKYHNAELGQDALIEVPVSKIISMVLPDESAKVHIAMLKLRSNVVPENICFLEFISEKSLNDFTHLVLGLDSSIHIRPKPLFWIEHAMGKTHVTNQDVSEIRGTKVLNGYSKKACESDKAEISVATAEPPANRRRLKDLLDAPQGQTVDETEVRRPERSKRYLQPQDNLNSMEQTITDSGSNRIRQTRSRSNREDLTEGAQFLQPQNIEPRRQGPEWKKPLTYPRDGPRRETVTWDDLLRLEDEEFLNDSLVAFFIRYLQEKMDQEELKRMHFFNTFFYETLMRPSGNKGGRRQINYKGVANWTKTINLFKRDYVIVPVNESAHWYVMIICNLRSLLPEDQATVNAKEEPATAPPKPDFTEHQDPTLVLDEHDVPSKDPVNEEAISPAAADSTAEHTDRRRLGRARKVPRQLPRYGVDEPVIITLDSLNYGRSPTATVLKDYLAEEAKEKLELDIDRSSIKGMTAKNIPLQGNFSDCGLYLCMYLEKFVGDPRKFVSSLLQRDTEAIQWPKRLRSGALRQRLYDMLQELHMAHQKRDRPNVPPIGKILIRDEDLLSEEQRYVKGGLAYFNDYSQKRKARSIERVVSEEPVTSDVQPTVPNDQVGQDKNDYARARHETETGAIVIDDDDPQVQSAPQDGRTSRFFAEAPKPSTQDILTIEDTPQDLAAQLREMRSPKRSMQLSSIDMSTRHQSPQKVGNTSSTVIDLSTPNRDQSAQRRRSASVSTDFLSGTASYDIQPEQASGNDDFEREKENIDAKSDEQKEDEEVFEGFDDNVIVAQRKERRHSSVVPESNYGDEPAAADIMQLDDTTAPDEMLLG